MKDASSSLPGTAQHSACQCYSTAHIKILYNFAFCCGFQPSHSWQIIVDLCSHHFHLVNQCDGCLGSGLCQDCNGHLLMPADTCLAA